MEQQKTPADTEDDIVQAFRVFDSDNKGYIESAELRELLENMDWKISTDELKDMITSANLHQDRRIGMEGKKPCDKHVILIDIIFFPRAMLKEKGKFRGTDNV